MAKKKKLESFDDPVDITPLIDIVFLLIIFFLVVGKFVADQVTLEVNIPVSEVANEQIEIKDKILIQLSPVNDGTVTINQSGRMPLTRVSKVLKSVTDQIRAAQGKDSSQFIDIPVLLRADRNTPWEYVHTINGHCQQLGLWNVKWKARQDD